MEAPKLFGLHASPPPWLNWTLALVPFVLIIAVYMMASNKRHEENPQDKLLPGISQMGVAVKRMAFEQDRRSGKYPLWSDTFASMKRLLIGVGVAATLALLLGLNMGLFRGLQSLASPFLTFFSMIPPLAVLPIIFLSFGVDEFAKMLLIFIGVFPVIARDIFLAVQKIPREQITKALTLGASQSAVVYQIVFPQIIPRLLETVRLSLGPAWLFLIASEAIAATDGLGYRIFLVRRYLSMDVILPYVFWITILGFTMDYLLRTLLVRRYRWYLVGK